MTPPERTPRAYLAWRIGVALIVPIGFGLYAVRLGRDANWDLQNYHWYSAYAFLTWRYEHDVAPAFGTSFFAPMLYVPWYVIGTLLPARALGFVIGAVQSANLLVLYGLGLVTLPIARRLWREIVALGLAFAGMCGGMSLGLLGTTFVDSIVSIGLLGSLWAVVAGLPVLADGPPAQAARRAALAAVPAALAIAGKLAIGPFVIGLAAGLLAIRAPLRRRLWVLLWFGIGGALTAAVALGPWLVHLWSTVGAPFYPFFARAFGSPYAGGAWSFDRWHPDRFSDVFVYPYLFATRGMRVAEIWFRDFRVCVAYFLIPVALALRLLRPPAQRPPLPAGLGVILVFMAVGYVLWLAMFSYYRYAVVLELVAPLATALALMAVPAPWWSRAAAVGAMLAGVVITTQPADWGHLPWTDRFIEVEVPPIESPRSATVLLSDQPTTFLVPSLPPDVAVIGIDMAVWTGGNPPAWSDLIRRRLAARSGAVYAVMLAGRETAAADLMRPFGLALDRARCRPMRSNLPAAGLPAVATLMFCAADRRSP
ncbi:hypothetical protein [Rhodoplanes roseus]|uniref:Glycosyltransferase RgtA/B/C/D-like domain-containing protein n=1 Tax=Rhodoplanes roseus TaxID=29409 RepID=A0A327L5P9_9BRAD|nr:hypothetical protein [Rhodoplanes roseus]RAI45707.1 hypothetical protein CH341_02490 [Rhodoplanes roseus]